MKENLCGTEKKNSSPYGLTNQVTIRFGHQNVAKINCDFARGLKIVFSLLIREI